LRRVAKLGNGWLPNYRSAQDAEEALSNLKQYLDDSGRNINEIGIEPRLHYENGDPLVWQDLVKGWAAVGATHLTVITMGVGFSTPQEHLKAITRYAKALDIKR